MTNPIEQAKVRLAGGSKWLKGDIGDYYGTGDVCVMGAIPMHGDLLCGALAADEILKDVVLEQYPDRMTEGSKHPVAKFNDHPDTVWSDVERVLEKASVKWDEVHG